MPYKCQREGVRRWNGVNQNKQPEYNKYQKINNQNGVNQNKQLWPLSMKYDLHFTKSIVLRKVFMREVIETSFCCIDLHGVPTAVRNICYVAGVFLPRVM